MRLLLCGLALLLLASGARSQSCSGGVPAVHTFGSTHGPGPTWTRPFSVGDGAPGSCFLSGAGSAVRYATYAFSVDAPGEYVLGVRTFDPEFDTYLHLYEGDLDPTFPCAGLIALDDDDGSPRQSTIGGGDGWTGLAPLALDPGQTYTAVVSGFGNDDAGPYLLDLTAPPGGQICPAGTGEPGFGLVSIPTTPLAVPTAGGFVRFRMDLLPFSGPAPVHLDVWALVLDSSMTEVVHVRRPRRFVIPAGGTRTRYNQRFPGYVPDGTYGYLLVAGEHDSEDPLASRFFAVDQYLIAKGGSTGPVFSAAETTEGPDDWDAQESDKALPSRSQDAIRLVANPVRDRATWSVTLDDAAEVEIAVHDLLGREVARVPARYAPAGTARLDLDVAGLAVGTYAVHVRIGSAVHAGRLAVVR